METNPGNTKQTPQETTQEAGSSTSGVTALQSEFSATLQSADGSAAQGVQMLQQVHQARLSLLTRTAANLKKQYGADDPRVKAAQAAVTATTATVNRVAMAGRQLTTTGPQVATTGWALHGRVFDAQGQPLAKYTVFLVDAQNVYQEAYGFAYTDETGYFLLNDAGVEAKAASRAATSPTLFVEIANDKSQPVYLSTTAFQPVTGSASYLNITVTGGSRPIGDPPAAIRSVAMPARKSQSSKAKREKSS